MPGINLVYDSKNTINKSYGAIKTATNQLIHNERFRVTNLIKTKQLFLAISGYEDYPIETLQDDQFKIFLEGKIYNKNISKINEELNRIVKSFTIDSELKKNLSDFINTTDGDFIFIIYDSFNRQILIFNDFLGRLPFYYSNDHERFLLSREASFISSIMLEREYDIFGIAENLLFGYPLSTRTLVKNINRVPPATFIKLDINSDTILIDKLSDFNFEEKFTEISDDENYTENLISLLKEATVNRLNSYSKNILSLSGGLDSRALAIILESCKKPFSSSTYIGYKEFAEKDAEGAKKISDKLALDWELIHIAPPKGMDMQKLINYKNGLNTLSSAFLLSFYDQLRIKHGNNMTYITGDGGDKVFPDHRPSIKVTGEKELLNYLISNKHFITPERIERLLGLKQKELYDRIIETLKSYPEKEMDYKYQRFIMTERGIKWLFEGEDRNRFYFWSVAPFYGLNLFKYSMSIPDGNKSGHKLYYQFLNKLSPELLEIKNALWNVPLNQKDFKFKIFNFMKDQVYPILPAKVKRKLRIAINKTVVLGSIQTETMIDLVNDLCQINVVKNYFSAKELTDIKNLSKAEFYNLLTVLLTMDDIENSGQVIRKYLAAEFI